jgi:hypothetical protein
MPHFNMPRAVVLAIVMVAFANAAQAASPQANTDAISLSTDGIIPPTGTQQPLHLTDAQRAQIRQALAGLQTQVEFKLKKVKKAKDFTPTVDAARPTGIADAKDSWIGRLRLRQDEGRGADRQRHVAQNRRSDPAHVRPLSRRLESRPRSAALEAVAKVAPTSG